MEKPLVNFMVNYTQGEGWSTENLLLVVPRRLFCFSSLVILDVARCYLWLFTLYINIKIGKNSCYMLDHLLGKLLFT